MKKIIILLGAIFIFDVSANESDKNNSIILQKYYKELYKNMDKIRKLQNDTIIKYKQAVSQELIKMSSSLSKKNTIDLIYTNNNKDYKLPLLPYRTVYFSLTDNMPVDIKLNLEKIKENVIEKYKKQYQKYLKDYQDEMNEEILKEQNNYIKNKKITQFYFYPYKNLLVIVRLYNGTYSIYYLGKNEKEVKLSKLKNLKSREIPLKG
jgi:hypothetical protein